MHENEKYKEKNNMNCMNVQSALFAITPTTATVTAGGALPLTTVARRITPRISLGSDSANIVVPGYYEIDASVTFTADAAGDVTITAYQNGEAIPGITATETVTTADTEVTTIALHGIIRVRCGEPVSITLANASGVAITTSNISLSVIRID